MLAEFDTEPWDGVVSPLRVSTTSSVLVGCHGQIVWVKIKGRGSFQNSAGLKEYVGRMVRRGHRDFVVDLEDCEQMDSTFMGTLAGVALRLREIGQGGLRAINVNERNAGLLCSLGLDQIFSVEEAGGGLSAPIAAEPLHSPASDASDAVDQQKTVLEAHEALVEVDSANEVKFHDVLEFLRQEQDAPDGGRGGDT